MSTVDADVIVELNQLAARYGAAVDACDEEEFLAVFHADGAIRAYHPDDEQPFADVHGHAELVNIPRTMSGLFRTTAHRFTNHVIHVDGDTATGSLLCTAGHIRVGREDEVLDIVIRYLDRYERRGGEWRIADRELRFLWSEASPVVAGLADGATTT